MIKKQYSITTSNFKKLIYKSQIEIEKNISILFESIYDKIDLSPYVSTNEAATIFKAVKFLMDSENFMLDLKNKNIINRDKGNSVASRSNYIFTSSPKYHENNDCKTLLNDFKNFEIPEEIRKKGDEEIAKFRDFAKENADFLKNGKEDIFIYKLKMKFSLKQPISKILYSNSGKIEVSKLSHLNIEENILNTIEKIEKLKETEEGRISIKKYMYAPDHAKNNKEINLTDKI